MTTIFKRLTYVCVRWHRQLIIVFHIGGIELQLLLHGIQTEVVAFHYAVQTTNICQSHFLRCIFTLRQTKSNLFRIPMCTVRDDKTKIVFHYKWQMEAAIVWHLCAFDNMADCRRRNVYCAIDRMTQSEKYYAWKVFQFEIIFNNFDKTISNC